MTCAERKSAHIDRYVKRVVYPFPYGGGFFIGFEEIYIKEKEMELYERVSTSLNFVEREKATRKFWEENGVFEKSIEMREGQENYTFYINADAEGQIFAFACKASQSGGLPADQNMKIVSATRISTQGSAVTVAELEDYLNRVSTL